MYTLKELGKFANGRIINGDENTEIDFFSTSRERHIKGEFYIPFTFKNINREIFIINSVRAGGKGFILNKDSENYDTIIKEAKTINPNICILEVENSKDVLHRLGQKAREKPKHKELLKISSSSFSFGRAFAVFRLFCEHIVYCEIHKHLGISRALNVGKITEGA